MLRLHTLPRHRQAASFHGLPLLVAVLVLLLSGCGGGAGANDDDNGQEEELAVPVEVSTAMLGSVSAAYEGTATLEAEETAVVVAKNTGVILEILAEEGDVVEAGQVVARLEADRYQYEAERNRATLERLEKAYERATELHGKNLISNDEYDRARFDMESQRAQYQLAQLDVQYTRIRAPIGGVVSERMVKAGNLVSQHEPVFRIDDFDPLLAVLHVPERELNTLRVGHPVSIMVDAFPRETFTGFVLRISPVVDPATGTFKVTAEVEDDSGRLKPGLFGRVRIIYDTREAAVLVSKDAVLSEDGEHTVYVVGADESVARRSIDVGYEESGMLEVLAGLEPGDTVVTAGKGSLRDGARIEVIES